ncbi:MULTISPECIES: acyl-CoA thioesterase [Nocardiaceae]|uniref:acyl-CoA thioesterase n=1 Tax=Nocardiaceae TaxID=85025 RepID=UPI00037DED92|nr:MULTISPECIES: thioesterase family protein [Rhodococcus]OZC55755.1 thioesterase [Rhodococcus sp. 06-621-2]OZC92802.1 thioesterase [Rhodococcus sp. 06-418-1B]OZD07630.1 thioesterase [Rhodococcus sp. 06-156-4C]OZD17159.1 thioesterase [Rhodococcus sp. 06-156-3C]OZD18497.1 thioesterase [Rhodococcus sp. 06-156-4a]
MTNSKPGYHATITVRWSDMDAFAHINHARMVTLLEEARIEWLLSTGDAPGERPEDRAAQANESLIKSALIANVNIAYKKPLRHSDSPLDVTLWFEQVRSVDFTIGYEVRAAGAAADSAPAVLATTRMAMVDVGSERLRRISPAEKEYLAKWTRQP